MSNYTISTSHSESFIAEIMSAFPGAELLSSGFTGFAFAISTSTVIKALKQELYDDGGLEMWETNSDGFVPSEILALKWANTVNNLAVKFVDHIHVETVAHLIAMERLFPCVPTAFGKQELEAAIAVAESQLEELWASGWAHGDLKRPDFVVAGHHNQDALFNNIILTEVEGHCVIRLIDTGFSCVEQYDQYEDLPEVIEIDKKAWQAFKDWILNYPRF